jgi:hypothetical protein
MRETIIHLILEGKSQIYLKIEILTLYINCSGYLASYELKRMGKKLPWPILR